MTIAQPLCLCACVLFELKWYWCRKREVQKWLRTNLQYLWHGEGMVGFVCLFDKESAKFKNLSSWKFLKLISAAILQSRFIKQWFDNNISVFPSVHVGLMVHETLQLNYHTNCWHTLILSNTFPKPIFFLFIPVANSPI